MAIIDYNDPFILWASARTASSAFFFEYVKRNNLTFPENGHEPLNPKDGRVTNNLSVDILDHVIKKYSFKCMVNSHIHKTSVIELKKLKEALPIINHRHIVLYRKDHYARQKSYLFSSVTGIWSKLDIPENKNFSGWLNLSEEEIYWRINHVIQFETEALNKYVELLNIFDQHEIPYQLIEFEEACKYIGKDTSQGTKQYYGEWESAKIKEQLLKLEDHEFYKRL
jgi:hypothetical protein